MITTYVYERIIHHRNIVIGSINIRKYTNIATVSPLYINTHGNKRIKRVSFSSDRLRSDKRKQQYNKKHRINSFFKDKKGSMMSENDINGDSKSTTDTTTNTATTGNGKEIDVVPDGANPNEEGLDPSTLFITKKPKDVFDGISKGAYNIFRGAAGGAAILVAAPISGALQGRSEGGAWGAVKGFGIGLGQGIIGGAALAVGGAVTGTYQMGAGLYHTPGAVSAKSKGKDWDDEKRVWVVYNLKEEADAVLSMSDEDYLNSLKQNSTDGKADTAAEGTDSSTANASASTSASNRTDRKVVDSTFYDLLGVKANATGSEIKKAYYIKAKECHPDRHLDDKEAHVKFQMIGEAYQVLSDAKLRANYDARGKDGVEGAPQMDNATLYAMIFGSEKFEHLIGQLEITSKMQSNTDDAAATESSAPTEDPRLLAFKQKKRQVQCAVNLVSKLQPYVDNRDEKEFIASLQDELKELTASPFGTTLVTTIGQCYKEFARQELGTIDGISVGMEQSWRAVTTRVAIASSFLKGSMTASEVQKLQKQKKSRDELTSDTTTDAAAAADASAENKDTVVKDNASLSPDEALLQKKIEEMSSHMFSALWHMSELDIRSTLNKVCKKVCHDHSIDVESRHARMLALLLMGDLFVRCGGTAESGLNSIMQQMQVNANKHGGH